MSFYKKGENTSIQINQNSDFIPNDIISENIIDDFKKQAAELKLLAPKADDFLYFTTVMMHAAEASGVDKDGNPKKTASGEEVKVGFDQNWRWQTNDKSVTPYRNQNLDIFPEEELKKAHKNWIGKPLCIDHKSSSIEHVRGFIVDTYYDEKLRRVIALCALDKKNYPDLAFKVKSGLSDSVSMGVGVRLAVCYDCGRKAQTERDFCDHVKFRTCYGEINTDLNPIELSIVVTPADAQAKIKHVFAAKKNLESYVNEKEAQLQKLAKTVYTAQINMDRFRENGEENKNIKPFSSQMTLTSDTLEGLKADIEQGLKKLHDLKSETDESMHNEKSDENDMVNDADSSKKEASLTATSEKDIYAAISRIESQLTGMKQAHDQLTNYFNKEKNYMSKENKKEAYWFGGGEGNEPTPGEKKYDVDPMNDKIRETGDKQMVGASPFPGVGDVEGLYPSPPSVPEKDELERKRMLARAHVEERATRRAELNRLAKAALEKRSYFYGGGEGNEPAQGKQKYKPDPMNEQLRKDDKQMVGAKPFPEVGKEDGLYPSPPSVSEKDELKRKEMLHRASDLTAKFSRARNADGSHNLAKSAWRVFNGDKLVLTASVEDVLGNDRAEILYATVANQDFGKSLLQKVADLGASKVESALKRAQVAPAAPAPAPAAPAAEPNIQMGGTTAPAADAQPATDEGKDGGTHETALELVEQVRDIASDAVEAVRALTGEQAEMGEMEADMKTASFETRSLFKIRKEINAGLIEVLTEKIASLRQIGSELNDIAKMYRDGKVAKASKEVVAALSDEAFHDARIALAETNEALVNVCKYARGADNFQHRVESEAELAKADDTVGLDDGHLDLDSMSDEELLDLLKSESKGSTDDVLSADDKEDSSDCAPADDKEDSSSSEDKHMANDIDQLLAQLDAEEDQLEEDRDLVVHDQGEEDLAEADMTVKVEDLPKVKPQTGDKITVAALDTRESRTAARAKLAAEYDNWLEVHHPKKTNIGLKLKDDLDVVETIDEEHDAITKVLNEKVKLRKQAEMIDTLVKAGQLSSSDVDSLVAEGVDAEAVAYYKKFYGQVDGGKEFATELVKEHSKASSEVELQNYKAKMARAYELTNEMVSRGLVDNTRGAISAQVDQIMQYNDEAFDGLKKVVFASKKVAAQAAMPQAVGGSIFEEQPTDLVSRMSNALAARSKKRF